MSHGSASACVRGIMARKRESGFSVVLFGDAAVAVEVSGAVAALGCDPTSDATPEDALKSLQTGKRRG